MTKIHRVEMAVDIRATRAAVWSRVSDHEGVPSWAPVRQVRIVESGARERGGLGAVRAVRFPRAPEVRERVTEFDPGRSYGYKIIAGWWLRRFERKLLGGMQNLKRQLETG